MILDFGSQLTQLIARRIRELNIYSEIVPFHSFSPVPNPDIAAVILSGSPASVRHEESPKVDIKEILQNYPTLGICYGAQLTAQLTGGQVQASDHREYGFAQLNQLIQDPIWNEIPQASQIWMSHSDTIVSLGEGFEVIASTESIPIAAFKSVDKNHPAYFVQFHPEVVHSLFGSQLLKNFLIDACQISADWTPDSFIHRTVEDIRVE